MKNFNRNLKAISPIFATLILIAIAVIAGVVVYMFTSGTLATMTGGGTAAQEKMSVQAIQFSNTTASAPQLSVYAQAQGNPVTLTNVIVKNSAGNVVGTLPVTSGNVGTTLTTINIVDSTGAANSFLNKLLSGTYTVTLVSSNGGNFVSPSFIP